MVPVTLVRIGLNGPRTSAGASGFRSHISSWLGPPSRKIKMHACAGAGVGVDAFACISSSHGKLRPPSMPDAPMRRKLRREMPSQVLLEEPKGIRMIDPRTPGGGDDGRK